MKILKKIFKILLKKIFKIFGFNIISSDRGFITLIKKKRYNLGKNLIGAEIGVYTGEHSEKLLKNLDIKKLYLIDPYNYDESDSSSTQSNLIKAEKNARKRLFKYKDKIEFIRKTSSEAVFLFKNNLLDFVYIDGNHLYKNAKEDMENYYKKIKSKGILAGHDIENGIWYRKNGVTKAFFDFVLENNLNPCIALEDWWVLKSEKESE